MGNHTVGTAMAKAAEIALKLRRPEHKALELLDLICEHWRGHDAEFDDYASLDGTESPALALLILEAFAPNGLADLAKYSSDDEDDTDAFYEEVYSQFRERYAFC